MGDLVLRRANSLKYTWKLEVNWEGPYKVTPVLAGGSYYLEDGRGKWLSSPLGHVTSEVLSMMADGGLSMKMSTLALLCFYKFLYA